MKANIVLGLYNGCSHCSATMCYTNQWWSPPGATRSRTARFQYFRVSITVPMCPKMFPVSSYHHCIDMHWSSLRCLLYHWAIALVLCTTRAHLQHCYISYCCHCYCRCCTTWHDDPGGSVLVPNLLQLIFAATWVRQSGWYGRLKTGVYPNKVTQSDHTAWWNPTAAPATSSAQVLARKYGGQVKASRFPAIWLPWFQGMPKGCVWWLTPLVRTPVIPELTPCAVLKWGL